MELNEYLDGKIILIDKPIDWSSFQVVNKIRWDIKQKYNIKKIKVGHAGTLDPKATGLLIICTGKATKIISEIQDANKEYIAEIKLGFQTDSYDTESKEINPKPVDDINLDKINLVLKNWVGNELYQQPPMFSAIKKNGIRAYEYARKGENIELKNRKISIQNIEIISFISPILTLKINCGKGTYIRSLAHDIGNDLGCGAYLTALQRTKIGEYSVENSENIFYNFK